MWLHVCFNKELRKLNEVINFCKVVMLSSLNGSIDQTLLYHMEHFGFAIEKDTNIFTELSPSSYRGSQFIFTQFDTVLFITIFLNQTRNHHHHNTKFSLYVNFLHKNRTLSLRMNWTVFYTCRPHIQNQ